MRPLQKLIWIINLVTLKNTGRCKIRVCRTAFIIGNEVLAEPISCLFRKSGVYVGIFEAPEYFTEDHGRFHNICVKIGSVVRSLRPKVIVLAGCSERVKTHFRQSFEEYDLMELDTFIEGNLASCPGFLPANRRLNIQVHSPESSVIGDVIAVDPNNEVTLSISKNLAAAMNAMLVLLPDLDRQEIDRIQDYHFRWNSASDAFDAQENRRLLFDILNERLGNIVTSGPRSITFITRGIPYGLIPFSVPTSHILNLPARLGVNIARGVAKTFLSTPRTPLAILVAPDTTVGAEVDDVRFILGQDSGYVVRTAIGENALAYRVSMLTEYLPSDLIIFSSHAGEVGGERITLEFEHPAGITRRLAYESVHTFNLIPRNENVHVVEFKRFVSLDGIRWPNYSGEDTPELRSAFGFYISNMQSRDFGQIISRTPIDRIRGSGVFKMADFNYAPAMHECGGYSSPFVIANACSTWRETSDRFVAAGASVYIGTAQDISDAIARAVLPNFLRRICRGQTAGYALAESQKHFVSDLGYTPYLMAGLIYSTLPPEVPDRENARKVRAAMESRLNSYRSALTNPAEVAFQERNQLVINFFEDELSAFTNRQRRL